MANMQNEKVPMPVQLPEIRGKNFDEVALGYSEEMAKIEASRCLNCKNKPCVEGCPVGVNIPDFISEINQGNFSKAFEIITKTNSLPAICGRVCPQETQCEGKCVRSLKGEPVAIGRLERFVADIAAKNDKPKSQKSETEKSKIAVIGAGPAGLTCAGNLIKKGFLVTIFESSQVAGGVLMYGIPEFRLPKVVVQSEIQNLKNLGVEIQTDVLVGRTVTIDEIFQQGFKAIFIGSGAGLPNFTGIDGENLVGVFSANEYLTRVNLMKAYKENYDTPMFNSHNIVVVGGGNVAMDAARCALRLAKNSGKVYVVYRRSIEEMPARTEEIHHAQEEGVEFLTLHNPVKIIGNDTGNVKSVELAKMILGEPDSSGRRRPVETDERIILECDTLIMAIGTSPNPLISRTSGLDTNKWGCLVVDENLQTSREGVFAGGDAVTGAATVISAMGAGKIAAENIARMLQN